MVVSLIGTMKPMFWIVMGVIVEEFEKFEELGFGIVSGDG